MERIITRIEPFGALLYDRKTTALIELDRTETREHLNYSGPFPHDITAPRFVHLEISNRCNKNPPCPYCYVPTMTEKEMTLEQLCELQRQLAEMKVFSVTYGGKEPFLRQDLFTLAKNACSLGLDVAITTNGILLNDDAHLGLFRQINISLHDNLQHVTKAAIIARKHTMVGINFIMKRDMLTNIAPIADLCKKHNLELLLLRYKPIHGDTEQAIDSRQIRDIATQLTCQGVRVAADSASCGLNVDGNWFVDVANNGDVYQCSFHRRSIGNILQQPFSEVWHNRPRDHTCPLHNTPRLTPAIEEDGTFAKTVL